VAENKKQSDQFDIGRVRSPPVGISTSAGVLTPSEKPDITRRFGFALEYWRDRAIQKVQRTYFFELEQGLAFNLVPVFLAAGIIIYFLAPAEPFVSALILLVIATSAFVWRSTGSGGSYRFAAAFLFVFMGMLAAKFAAIQSSEAMIPRQITGMVAGTIISVDENRRGAPRYIIAPGAIEGLDHGELPRYVRLSTSSKSTAYEPGEFVEGVARLQPVLGPAYPGSFDFSFHAHFNGIGGSGFFMGAPTSTPAKFHQPLSLGDNIRIAINQFRVFIKKRIELGLPGNTGKIATALVIGDKSGIPAEAQDALRATGLAHILAISGLHMALVTLTTLWILRLLFSLNPRLVLHYPIKKWAALGAVVLATGYLLISGMGVATQRAWIMISIMLAAVLLDRRAITLRNVAISAIIILIVDPSSLLAPGFQMSFAAVVALVSAYEAINRRRRSKLDETPYTAQNNLVAVAVKNIGSFTGGLFTTSLVAGLATSFIAAWHFHQVAPLGLLANLLAMPIVTLFVMPAVLFSIVLIPLGLDSFSLAIVSKGIETILQIAFWVNGLMPVAITGVQTIQAFMLFVLGFGVLTLFKSKSRLIGIVILLLIPFFVSAPNVPLVLIAENGRSIAVRTPDGTLAVLLPKRENFVTGIWGKAYSRGRIPYAGLSKEQCNRDRCIYTFENGMVFHLVYAPDLLIDACQNADILAAPRLKWVNCKDREPEIILKREDFESRGAHAIHYVGERETAEKSSNRFFIETAFGTARRPWHRQAVTYQDQ